MRLNNCTLLIDGNWLLLSRFSVINKGFDKKNPDYMKEQASLDLQDLLARSINVILNRFPIIDNMIFISDGGSWRKQLPIPKSLHDITYKGNRTTNVEMDWHYIYGALNKVFKHCKDLGVTCSNYSNIEGDDWVWYWSRRLNAEGTNCVIWSSDNDLKQLIQVDNKMDTFTAWYNDKNGLWLPNDLEEEIIDPLEFFMQPMKYTSPVLEALKSKSNSVNFIDPNTIILSKIICGDAGDNIKSVVRYKKGNRTYRISEKDWDKIASKLNIITIQDFLKHKENVAKAIVDMKKLQPYNIDIQDVIEMIEYNIKLVWLNEKVIPDTAVQAMNQIEYKPYDLSYIKNNYKILYEEDDNDIQKLFESI